LKNLTEKVDKQILEILDLTFHLIFHFCSFEFNMANDVAVINNKHSELLDQLEKMINSFTTHEATKTLLRLTKKISKKKTKPALRRKIRSRNSRRNSRRSQQMK